MSMRVGADRGRKSVRLEGKIILKSRMRMRARFAAFSEILTTEWQYDELEIPINFLSV